MKKRIQTILFFLAFMVPMSRPAIVSAKTLPVMASLKSYIQTYGVIRTKSAYGSIRYTATISYQKKNKRFLYKCTYTNGRSTSAVKMYMPDFKKPANYTVYFNETVRASGRTAKITGKAKLKRQTYNDNFTNLKFSRSNKTKAAKKITNKPYQFAANSLLKVAFKMWESGLETRPTLCFRNFGFKKVTVIDKTTYSKEW